MEGSPPPRRALVPVLGLLFALLGSASLVGCFAPESMATKETRRELARLVYPVDAPLGPDLDIIAERMGPILCLSNRTAAVYRDYQLWLNCHYVNTVPLIQIGSDNPLTLDRWVNNYGETFPVGSFLLPDQARALVWSSSTTPKPTSATASPSGPTTPKTPAVSDRRRAATRTT